MAQKAVDSEGAKCPANIVQDGEGLTLVSNGIKYFGCKPKVSEHPKFKLDPKPIVDLKTSKHPSNPKNVVLKCKSDFHKTTPTPSVVRTSCPIDKVVTSKSDSSQSNMTDFFSRLNCKRDKVDKETKKDKSDKELVEVENLPEVVNLLKPRLKDHSVNESMQTIQNEVKNGRNNDLVKSKDKNLGKILSRGQNSKDISDYFVRADPALSFNTSMDKLKIQRSRDQSKPVKPIKSQGWIKGSKNKIDRSLKSQPSLEIFLSKRKERKDDRDIATCTPGKRKFTEIQSIF